MAKRAPDWAAIIAEAETGPGTHAAVAARHRVNLATLKYHLYRSRKAKPEARLLPVRAPGTGPVLVAEFGAVRLSFREGCDPEFVAAVLRSLGSGSC
jgi:hypothetical protein